MVRVREETDKVPCCFRFFAFCVAIVDILQACIHGFVLYHLFFRPTFTSDSENPEYDMDWYMYILHYLKYPVYDENNKTDFWISVVITLEQGLLILFAVWRMFQAVCQSHSLEQWEKLTNQWRVAEILFLVIELSLYLAAHFQFYVASRAFPWAVCFHVFAVVMGFCICRQLRKCCCKV